MFLLVFFTFTYLSNDYPKILFPDFVINDFSDGQMYDINKITNDINKRTATTSKYGIGRMRHKSLAYHFIKSDPSPLINYKSFFLAIIIEYHQCYAPNTIL